jgi:class I lanthipeptide synthase
MVEGGDKVVEGAVEQGAWRPLLKGSDAERAREGIAEIAAALASTNGRDPDGPSVAAGQAGTALFHAYLHAAEPAAGYDERAVADLDAAIDAVAEMALPPQLYGGFPGVAWAVEHLRGRLFALAAEEEDPNEEIDAAVRERLGVSPWRADYDLIVGLAGLGVYALERLPRPEAAECLRRLLDRLEELAERSPRGITWFTPPELLWEGHLIGAPNGYYNLGLAHGVPGVIAVLAEMVGAGVEVERSRRLLEGAVSWLLAQQEDGSAGFLFPGVIGPGVKVHQSRLAWCYGDPGVAAALFLAGRRAGEPAWERAALAVAREAARRPPEHSGIFDAGLCHGSAGLGHLFNRLYQASGEEELAAAARFWYRHALDFRRPGEGVGGYRSWEPETLDGEFQWLARPGFLTGAAGIGLALLAAISEVEPMWDRLLLTSIPPAPAERSGRR